MALPFCLFSWHLVTNFAGNFLTWGYINLWSEKNLWILLPYERFDLLITTLQWEPLITPLVILFVSVFFYSLLVAFTINKLKNPINHLLCLVCVLLFSPLWSVFVVEALVFDIYTPVSWPSALNSGELHALLCLPPSPAAIKPALFSDRGELGIENNAPTLWAWKSCSLSLQSDCCW